jgi:2-dehydropantoate 2-reductase
MPQFEFAILGAGAIGSILGAHLVRSGRSVVMLARGRRAEQLRSDGLRIKGLVEFSTAVQVVTGASQFTGAQVLIVAMKTPGTAAALEPLRNASIDAAFSIQNGLMKNDLLTAAFGANRVLGSLADTSGELLASGEVLFTRNVNIQIGELGGGDSARAQKIAAAIDASGVRSTAVPNILELEWSKFVAWAGLMALAVTTRANTWKYLDDPGSALVLVRLVREMGEVAKAAGIHILDRSMLPAATLLTVSESEGVELVRKAGRHYRENSPEHRMSALQDLIAGRPLEVEETLGYAVHKARQFNLSLPLMDAFYHLVQGISRIATCGERRS